MEFTTEVPTPKVMYVKDVKASGTAGGGCTSGSWVQRDINTITGDAFGSVAANVLTLPVGEYEIEITTPGAETDGTKSKLENTSDTVDEILSGQSYFSASGS